MTSKQSDENSDVLLQMDNSDSWRSDVTLELGQSCSKCGHPVSSFEVEGQQKPKYHPLASEETENTDVGPKEERNNDNNIIYGTEDTPPWHICLLLGMQHFLMMAPGSAVAPLLLATPLCIMDSDPARGYLVTSMFFVSGLTTILQTIFGVRFLKWFCRCRLPVIQGPTVAVFIPLVAMLSQTKWKCPDTSVLRNMTSEEQTEEWQLRMREAQGAVIVASLLEVILGATGAVGFLLRWITPLVITPIIAMIGLSLSQIAADQAGQQWGIAALCVVLVVVMSQYLKHIQVPIPFRTKTGRLEVLRLPVFALFPVIIAIVVTWVLCVILTVTNVFEEGNSSRTDRNIGLVDESPWFYFPYPGQFGAPTFSFGAIVGVMAGILASTIESVGDYYSCARLAGAAAPPSHAVNRGILFEGLGSLISGLYGTGCGTTSYSSNIAAMGITRVASRRVIQVSAVFMLLSGVLGKLGAVFVTLPEAIIGGIFICIFGMITAVGLSTLQYVNMNSSRNLFILGLSIFFSMVGHDYLTSHPNAVNTGSSVVDNIINILLQTTMFSAGVIAFILDNTVPGTDEERGLTKWREQQQGGAEDEDEEHIKEGKHIYNPPYTSYLNRWSWTRYIPFLPTIKH